MTRFVIPRQRFQRARHVGIPLEKRDHRRCAGDEKAFDDAIEITDLPYRPAKLPLPRRPTILTTYRRRLLALEIDSEQGILHVVESHARIERDIEIRVVIDKRQVQANPSASCFRRKTCCESTGLKPKGRRPSAISCNRVRCTARFVITMGISFQFPQF